MPAKMNCADMRRPPIDLQKWKGLRLATDREDVGLPARNEDKIASSHVQRLPVFECDHSRTTSAEIMEYRKWKLRHRHAARPAKLVVKKQSAGQADAVEQIGQVIQAQPPIRVDLRSNITAVQANALHASTPELGAQCVGALCGPANLRFGIAPLAAQGFSVPGRSDAFFGRQRPHARNLTG